MSTLVDTEVQSMPVTRTLTAIDRCDRCGAQAYLRVEFITGELLFCAHHAHEHEDKLTKSATAVHDERHILAALEKPVL